MVDEQQRVFWQGSLLLRNSATLMAAKTGIWIFNGTNRLLCGENEGEMRLQRLRRGIRASPFR
ncbi:hypothetical protein DQG13_22670 [Paenibacillus sp. YN15]|nr:hypothetical protein DQG13_22670 [Paenibacillus sp. YN15]